MTNVAVTNMTEKKIIVTRTTAPQMTIKNMIRKSNKFDHVQEYSNKYGGDEYYFSDKDDIDKDDNKKVKSNPYDNNNKKYINKDESDKDRIELNDIDRDDTDREQKISDRG